MHFEYSCWLFLFDSISRLITYLMVFVLSRAILRGVLGRIPPRLLMQFWMTAGTKSLQTSPNFCNIQRSLASQPPACWRRTFCKILPKIIEIALLLPPEKLVRTWKFAPNSASRHLLATLVSKFKRPFVINRCQIQILQRHRSNFTEVIGNLISVNWSRCLCNIWIWQLLTKVAWTLTPNHKRKHVDSHAYDLGPKWLMAQWTSFIEPLRRRTILTFKNIWHVRLPRRVAII